MISKKIYLNNLNHFNTGSKFISDSKKLLEMFSPYGEVKSIEISMYKNFGVVEMSSSYEANTAKEKLNGVIFNGTKLMLTNDLKSKETD